MAVQFLDPTFAGSKIAVLIKKQMAKGEDSEGNRLGDYSEGWGEYRESRGKQTDFIDLEFTGDLYDKTFVEGKLLGAKKAGVVMGSTSPHWEEIKDDERFEKAVELNSENRDKVGFMVASYIQKSLLKYYII
jgi:hypothetical protein